MATFATKEAAAGASSVAEVLTDAVKGEVVATVPAANVSNKGLVCYLTEAVDRAVVARAPVAWAEPATGTMPSILAHRPAKSPTRTTRRAARAISCSATHRRSALADHGN